MKRIGRNNLLIENTTFNALSVELLRKSERSGGDFYLAGAVEQLKGDGGRYGS